MGKNMREESNAGFDLDEVLFRATRREATADELRRLESRLMDSEEERRAAWRFLCNDALLSELACGSEADSPLDRLLHAEKPTVTPHSAYAGSPLGRLLNAVDRHGLRVLAVAASLVAVLLVKQYSMQARVNRLHALALVSEDAPEGDPPTEIVSGSTNDGRGAVGRVSGLRDVAWAPDQQPLRFGDPIRPGDHVRVAAGVVELLLTNGAKITLEGPAEFESASALEAHLGLGKIAAAAPRTARGYTVFTPTAELCDIGTQFGVVVDGAGDSELHVFDGDVVARSRSDGAVNKLVHARENEAMRFRRDSLAPELIVARSTDFVRRVAPTPAAAELPPLPVTSDLVAWYDASCSVTAEIGEPVSTVRDILVGDNTYADDAIQFDPRRRPTLVDDGQGRPALRFDGKQSFLATSPVETGEAETVFVAFAPAPISYAEAAGGSVLLSCGEAPRVQLLLDHDYAPRGAIVLSADGRRVGELRAAAVEASEVAVLGYSHDGRRAEMWLNGVSQGVADADELTPRYASRYLGNHEDPGERSGFFGAVYEVVLYGESLPAEAITRLHAYFQQRYEPR